MATKGTGKSRKNKVPGAVAEATRRKAEQARLDAEVKKRQAALTEELKTVSTGEQWLKCANEQKNIKVPSGAIITVRRLTIMEVATVGHIELALVGEVMLDLAKLDAPINLQTEEVLWKSITEDRILQMLTMFRKAAVVCVVDPVLSFTPDAAKGELDIKEIKFDDLSTIWVAAVKRGAAQFNSFRQE